jgi:hypothetical protein
MMSRRLLFPVLAALFAAVPAQAAIFERVNMGARGIALAGAYGADVRDVSAAHWNPAALGRLTRGEAMFTHSRPYIVPDLASNSVAAGLPAWEGGAAVSWHRFGVDGVTSEDLIGLSFGRWIYRDNRRVVHAGGTAKLAVLSYDANAGSRDFGSKSRFTGDLGVVWEEGSLLSFAAVWRHVLRPEFNFVGQGGGTQIPGGFEVSAAYRWRPDVAIFMGVSEVGDRVAWNYAGELWFYEVFAVRAGVHDTEFAGGVGLRGKSWEVDASFVTHKNLGNSYWASIHVFLPEKKPEAAP